MADDQPPQEPTNPYAAPKAPVAPPKPGGGRRDGKGTFELGECLRDGWRNTIANFLPILGVGIVGFLLTIISYLTIVGIFLVLPILAYGGTKFLLGVHDGRANFNDLFAGFKNYGSVLAKMLVWMLIMILLSLVGSSVQYIGMAMESEGMILIGALVSWVWGFGVMIRFYWAPMFIVDDDMGGVEAIGASWEATRGNWLMLIVLAFLTVLVAIAGMLALLVGLFVAIPMGYLMYVSAYRQTVGGPELDDAEAGTY